MIINNKFIKKNLSAEGKDIYMYMYYNSSAL